MDRVKIDVIFRRFKSGESVVAIFPYDVQYTFGHVGSYEHVGQHCACDYQGVLRISRKATENEYQELLDELRSLGYDCIIHKKINYKKYLKEYHKLWNRKSTGLI